jgi:hypothetical protein
MCSEGARGIEEEGGASVALCAGNTDTRATLDLDIRALTVPDQMGERSV